MTRRSPASAQRAPAEPPLRRPIAVRTLSRRQPHPFDLSPEPDEAGAIARFLGLQALRRLRFRGELAPSGAEGWRIDAELSAEVVQSCVVTLEPVVQRIEPGVPPAEYRAAPPGVSPLAEGDLKPFAKLSVLKDKLGGGEG
jgi:hypothetical protein